MRELQTTKPPEGATCVKWYKGQEVPGPMEHGGTDTVRMQCGRKAAVVDINGRPLCRKHFNQWLKKLGYVKDPRSDMEKLLDEKIAMEPPFGEGEDEPLRQNLVGVR